MCTWKKKKSQVKPYTYTFVVNKEAGAVKLTGSIQLTLKKKRKINNNKKYIWSNRNVLVLCLYFRLRNSEITRSFQTIVPFHALAFVGCAILYVPT